MNVTLVNSTDNPIMAIAKAASNCYDSKAHKGIVKHCFESGHHSVLEFADFHFHIEGVSRSLLAQLTRHRIASYAVRSQRYCVEDRFTYDIPDSIEKVGYWKDIYEKAMQYLQSAYKYMVENGVPPEDARQILPNACHTIIDMKINLRSLINFMNLRLCSHAQAEIRQLAQEMKRVIVERYPELDDFLQPKCEHMGYCNEGKKCCGRKPAKEEVFAVYEATKQGNH